MEKTTINYINSLINEGSYETALKELVFKQEQLFKLDPIWTIKTHIQILVDLEKLGDALEELAIYKTYPYVSMEIEDLIKDITISIKAKVNKQGKQQVSKGEILSYLNSDDYEVVSRALFLIRSSNPFDFISELEALLVSEKDNNIKTLTLLILLEINYNKPLLILKNGQKVTIKPDQISMPFADDIYLTLKDKIIEFSKDISQNNFANEYAKVAYLNLYPLMFDLSDLNYLTYYFHFKAINALGGDITSISFLQDYGLDNNLFSMLEAKYHLE